MPQQLIYTSAPRGLVAGRSGHCTVARSPDMREALMLQLEKLSYYQHLSLSGGRERPIFSCRVLDIRGSQYHVLSRIRDAGLDFTGRTNFLAHHLVFTPQEIRRLASPPAILRGWPGWVRSWSQEPQVLEKEDWSALAALSTGGFVPATTWQQVTGDAVNGYSLLESRAGLALRVDSLSEEQILALFAETLELLELRDARRDFHATAWQYTFTTSMQEQDNPADFRWRCLHADNPASSRFAGPDCRPLSDLRAQRVTAEEAMLARSGRQPPRFLFQPQNVRVAEGGTVCLQAKAEGVPSPSYQWFSVDRAGNGQMVPNGTGAELVVQNPPLGLSRYVVRASNSQGEVTSQVATLSVDPKPRLEQVGTNREPRWLASRASAHVKSEDQIDRQRRQLQAKQAEAAFQKKQGQRRIFAVCAVAAGVITLILTFWCWQHKRETDRSASNPTNAYTHTGTTDITPQSKASPGVEVSTPPPYDAPATNASQQGQPVSSPASRPPEAFGLPPGWTQMLVGDVTEYRAECVDAKPPLRFDLSAAGSGFATNGDILLFVCRTNTGKEFKATLLKFKADHPQSRMGIMLRESAKPDSAFLFIGASQKSIIVSCRDDKKPLSSRTEEIPKAEDGKPLILKLSQKHAGFVASYSFDSKHWPSFPELVISTNVAIHAGFTVSSGSVSQRVSARFVEASPPPQ
jgi:GTPase-associated protein 1, N-terminal domain type 2/Immunoglobulin I-set domain